MYLYNVTLRVFTILERDDEDHVKHCVAPCCPSLDTADLSDKVINFLSILVKVVSRKEVCQTSCKNENLFCLRKYVHDYLQQSHTKKVF